MNMNEWVMRKKNIYKMDRSRVSSTVAVIRIRFACLPLQMDDSELSLLGLFSSENQISYGHKSYFDNGYWEKNVHINIETTISNDWLCDFE